MTPSDWIALLGIALPLFAKVAVDVAAYLTARKHAAMANIVGMAGRLAASNARLLASFPPGTDIKAIERGMIGDSVQAIGQEMAESIAIKKATKDNLAMIAQGELDKVLTAKAAPLIVLPVDRPTPIPSIPRVV